MDTIGARLLQARDYAGISQSELARKSGVSQTIVSRLERNEAKRTRDIVRLARACGVNSEWLAEGVGEMVNKHKQHNVANVLEDLLGFVQQTDPILREKVINLIDLYLQSPNKRIASAINALIEN
jgi:transcriptional regulator with XRE-family HTH domain